LKVYFWDLFRIQRQANVLNMFGGISLGFYFEGNFVSLHQGVRGDLVRRAYFRPSMSWNHGEE
jgi:hypothetical protein